MMSTSRVLARGDFYKGSGLFKPFLVGMWNPHPDYEYARGCGFWPPFFKSAVEGSVAR